MYALLLTENIYNVAADRTIALLRAAHSVGFLLTLVTYFLLVQTVMAFRFPFFLNAIFVGMVSYLLVFQSLWSSVLEESVSRRVGSLSIAIAVALSELAWLFSFGDAVNAYRAFSHDEFLRDGRYGSAILLKVV